MSIKQFNGNWAPLEDRLMFRFNTTEGAEYRLWLTRRITQALIQGSQHLVKKALEKKHEPQAAQAIQEFQQEALKQKTDFKVEYEESQQLPLGEQPVLVVGLVMKEEGELMSIDFQLLNQQNLNIKLSLPMLQAMVLLIDKLQEIPQWRVGLPEHSPEAQPSVTLTGTPSPSSESSGGPDTVH